MPICSAPGCSHWHSGIGDRTLCICCMAKVMDVLTSEMVPVEDNVQTDVGVRTIGAIEGPIMDALIVESDESHLPEVGFMIMEDGTEIPAIRFTVDGTTMIIPIGNPGPHDHLD